MANSPTDFVPSMMKEDFGTKCLITNAAADRYMSRSERLGPGRCEKWCGGKGGFDDYCERVED